MGLQCRFGCSRVHFYFRRPDRGSLKIIIKMAIKRPMAPSREPLRGAHETNNLSKGIGDVRERLEGPEGLSIKNRRPIDKNN
jgi:hypothetical protein